MDIYDVGIIIGVVCIAVVLIGSVIVRGSKKPPA